MLTDSDTADIMSTSPPADVTDELNDAVPQTADTDGTSLPADVTDELTDVVPQTADTDGTSPLADVTDELTDAVPQTADTDGPCTTECDGGDWSAEVKEENLPVVKQEPDDVCYNCCIIIIITSSV